MVKVKQVGDGMTQAYVSGESLGSAIGGAIGGTNTVARNVRHSLGAAYTGEEGIPKWAGLQKVLDAAQSPLSAADIKRGMIGALDRQRDEFPVCKKSLTVGVIGNVADIRGAQAEIYRVNHYSGSGRGQVKLHNFRAIFQQAGNLIALLQT